MFRSFLTLALPVVLSACVHSEIAAATTPANSVPLGIDLGGSGPVTAVAEEVGPSSQRPHAEAQIAHEGHNDVHATGTVNAVDATQHKVTISHKPIPTIGWPAMTMEFSVVPSLDLRPIKPGTRVDFTMEQGAGGMYEIQSLTPAGGQ